MLIAGRKARWVFVVVWMGFIFYLSAIPGSEIPGIVPDYVAHAFVYSVLTALVFYALGTDESRARNMVLTVMISSFYGATDELHQLYVPMRTASVFDFAVDSAASIVVAVSTFCAFRMKLKGDKADLKN